MKFQCNSCSYEFSTDDYKKFTIKLKRYKAIQYQTTCPKCKGSTSEYVLPKDKVTS